MLWFKYNKKLVTEIAVMHFGATKSIASPIILLLINNLSNTNSNTGIKDYRSLYKIFILLEVAYMYLIFYRYVLLKYYKS